MSEREFTDRLKAAFPGGEPSDEFIAKLGKSVKPRRTVKRFIPAFAAVIAVMIFVNLGVYAASEITFKDIVTDRVHVANSELTESLMGTVRSFSFKVSDDAYAIRILGVTGGERNMIGQAEIYRKDGEPVIDHFTKTPDGDDKLYPNFYIKDNAPLSSSSSHIAGFKINDDGNIIFDWDLDTDHSLNGKKITMSGKNFYFVSDVEKFEEENNMFDSNTEGELRFVNDGEKTINDIAADDLATLGLEWSFSFKYGQSKFSLNQKRRFIFNENFKLIRPVTIFSVDDTGNGTELEVMDQEITCVPKYMKFSNTGGTIKYSFTDEFDYDSYISEKYGDLNVHTNKESVLNSTENEIYLVKSDGTHINMRIGAGHGGGVVGKPMKMVTEFYYYDPEIKEGANKIFTDISDVVSVYINGTTYSLK